MYNHDNVIEKLTNLYWRVHGTMDSSPKGNDLTWCRRILDDVKSGGLVPDKQEFVMANLMWKKYSNGVLTEDEGMWSLIDELLTQETPSKIGAIKIYRRFVNSTLREAKEAVDNREYNIKNGWDNVTIVKPDEDS